MSENILCVKNIKKSFGGVHALKGVDLTIKKGETHCLAGENGCGKSTIIKVISGFYKPDEGTIEIDGKGYTNMSTADAIAAIFELVKYANQNTDSSSSKAYSQALLDELTTLCDVLGILVETKEEMLDSDIEALIEERQQARKNRDFARADEIRDELLEKGIVLEDTREGVKWKRA